MEAWEWESGMKPPPQAAEACHATIHYLSTPHGVERREDTGASIRGRMEAREWDSGMKPPPQAAEACHTTISPPPMGWRDEKAREPPSEGGWRHGNGTGMGERHEASAAGQCS
ncbi:MAG: hypothetical protein AMXMBFR61_00140 [Fimbriimonadales bacterium]